MYTKATLFYCASLAQLYKPSEAGYASNEGCMTSNYLSCICMSNSISSLFLVLVIAALTITKIPCMNMIAGIVTSTMRFVATLTLFACNHCLSPSPFNCLDEIAVSSNNNVSPRSITILCAYHSMSLTSPKCLMVSRSALSNSRNSLTLPLKVICRIASTFLY